MTKERKLELIEFIVEHQLHSSKLRSVSEPSKSIAKSAWSIVLQLITLVNREYAAEQKSVQKVLQLLAQLPKSHVNVNGKDMARLKDFLNTECRHLSFEDFRFVVGWFHKLAATK